jgi:hypothetical protein
MKYFRIKQLQYAYGYDQLQNLIDTGAVWTLEGSFGRAAMDALESGACMLPTSSRKNYYGSSVPSRYQVKQGTTGSYQNSVRFYSKLIF